MSRRAQIAAVVAALAAAGCADSFPSSVPPLDRFDYPVGIAVRPLPSGRSALLVVSTNFDLRYDQDDGGSLLSVDPDASHDLAEGGGLAVLGALRIGSFGGEIAWADGKESDAVWRPAGTFCPPLAADPAVAAGGAKVLVASRALERLYRIDMDAQGALACGAGCEVQLPIQLLDPYGVTIVCSRRGGISRADAYFTHLRGVNNQGWLSRLDLLSGETLPLAVGVGATYTSAFDPDGGNLFVSTRIGIGNSLRWVDVLPEVLVAEGVGLPRYGSASLGSLVQGGLGGLTRDVAVSGDRRFLYLSIDLFDDDAFARTGQILTKGGAVGVFDLTPTALGEPELRLDRLVPTCVGAGQLRVLPPRPGRRDLLAVTCDAEGALALYDDDVGKVVSYVGLDPGTGAPELGRQPFGIAVEPIDPSRAVAPASPCGPGRPCSRIYAASFARGSVSLLELDPDDPASVALVKRIGSGP
jgi:hypothetical protein